MLLKSKGVIRRGYFVIRGPGLGRGRTLYGNDDDIGPQENTDAIEERRCRPVRFV